MKKLLLVFLLLSAIVLLADNKEHGKMNYWQNNTFHQQSVKEVGKDYIVINVNNTIKRFSIIELPQRFLDWDFSRRKETLKKIKKGSMPPLSGPHNGIVATYGMKRDDASFSINNAVKGMGFVPQKTKIKEIINLLNSTIDSSLDKKIAVLTELYENEDNIFDKTKQVSLELYSTPEFETQSFLNEMADPEVAIVFLDIPSYKLKAIAQLLHPNDPQLNNYEKDVVEYINLIHSYFHGHFSKKFIGVIYHIIEIYDNSPGKGGKGIKIFP